MHLMAIDSKLDELYDIEEETRNMYSGSSHYSADYEVKECCSDNYSSNVSSNYEYDDLISAYRMVEEYVILFA